jgi:hypothetical protein
MDMTCPGVGQGMCTTDFKAKAQISAYMLEE